MIAFIFTNGSIEQTKLEIAEHLGQSVPLAFKCRNRHQN